MKTEIVPVFGLGWHSHQSPSQRDVLIDPLRPYILFEQLDWDGVRLELSKEKIKASPIVFFFFPPPSNLLSDPDARLVWIPMWDEAIWRSLDWWKTLPKSLRIVAFSEQIRIRAQAAGLPTFSIKYAKNPADCKPAQLDGRRVLFYWNRTGLVEPGFIENICKTLHIDLLLFRSSLDPYIPIQYQYSISPKIGNTIVQEVPGIELLSRSEYLNIFEQANIVIAPRLLEGVGVTFIEALARGCAVFAHNAPTMNEYIRHGQNGYLFSSYSHNPRNFPQYSMRQLVRLFSKLKSRIVDTAYYAYPVTKYQNWKEIGSLDLQALGCVAREDQIKVYTTWQKMVPTYAQFILDWL